MKIPFYLKALAAAILFVAGFAIYHNYSYGSIEKDLQACCLKEKACDENKKMIVPQPVTGGSSIIWDSMSGNLLMLTF